MAIDKEEVRRIARLANLEYPRTQAKDGSWVEPDAHLIDDPLLESLSKDLSQILEHIRELDQLDTSAVPPTSGLVAAGTHFRDDVAVPSTHSEAILEGAPQRSGNAVLVPRVVE